MNNVNRLKLLKITSDQLSYVHELQSTCIMDSQRRIISLKIFVNMCAYVKKESHTSRMALR